MNAKMGWLVKPSGLVEPKGLLDGQVEGADQDGVKDGGHGDNGQHGCGELAHHAEHGHLDGHKDDARDKGGHERCDDGDGRLNLAALGGGVTMTAISMAAMPSAAKSTNGEVVVIWITAAEMRPMTSA